MKKLAVLVAALVSCAGAANADNVAFIAGQGVHVPDGDTDPCPPSALTQNHDGSTEFAFTWTYMGIQEPDYGAFAEGYRNLTNGTVCGIEFYLTCWGSMNGAGTIDLFVWDYDVAADNPGSVLAVTASVPVSGVAYWPGISTHDLDVTDAAAPANGFFVGYWPRSFAEGIAQFGCAMDQDGLGGVPRTNIAPGIGYPTGWHNLTIVGYPMVAWGIGPWVVPGTTPAEKTSWGTIKALYN
jgi:hypothetical protein